MRFRSESQVSSLRLREGVAGEYPHRADTAQSNIGKPFPGACGLFEPAHPLPEAYADRTGARGLFAPEHPFPELPYLLKKGAATKAAPFFLCL